MTWWEMLLEWAVVILGVVAFFAFWVRWAGPKPKGGGYPG